MKTIFLIYSGDFHAISGGYIYNRRLVENLKYWDFEVHTVQIAEKQIDPASEEGKRLDLLLSEMPENSIILADSLVFGYNLIFWEKYSPSHFLIPLMHLPLFLNPDCSGNMQLKEKEINSLHLASHIVVTSCFTKQILVQEGIQPGKITVIVPGIEVFHKKEQYSAVPKQLLCVSGISFGKNQLLLLKALYRLRMYNWTLSLVGSTFSDLEYFLQVLSFIDAKGLNNRVLIMGEITGEDLMKVYYHSDLFLFPSILETYGMVVAEALSYGLPVFAYESGGIHQNFPRYPVHFFHDENSLYRLLLKVFEDEGFYSLITKEMIQITPSFHSWEIVAKLFAGLFKKIEDIQLQKTFHE